MEKDLSLKNHNYLDNRIYHIRTNRHLNKEWFKVSVVKIGDEERIIMCGMDNIFGVYETMFIPCEDFEMLFYDPGNQFDGDRKLRIKRIEYNRRMVGEYSKHFNIIKNDFKSF